jgi:hypothetical protein
MRLVAAALCGIALCSLTSCSKKPAPTTEPVATSAAAATDESAPTVGSGAMPTPAPSPTPPWGTITFSTDLVVAFTPVCAAVPAGVGPNSGYTLTFGVNDQVSYGKLRVPEYAGADGTFNESDKLLTPDPALAIVFKTNSLVARKDSTISTSLSEHGLHGFTQMGNFSLNGSTEAVGYITWECAELKT